MTTHLKPRSPTTRPGVSRLQLAIVAALLPGLLTLSARSAAAQTQVAPPWTQCWILSASGGVASAASESGPLIGAAVSWDLTHRFGVEASSSWMNWGQDTTGAAVAITARIMVTDRRSVTPFVQGGIGAFVMTVDPSGSDVPDFYRRRLTPGSQFQKRTFTDPSAVIGLGVDVRASNRMSVRPVVDLTTVVRDGNTATVVTGRVEFAYYLQLPRITPTRR